MTRTYHSLALALIGALALNVAAAQTPPPITPPATGAEKITCQQSGVNKTCTSLQIGQTLLPVANTFTAKQTFPAATTGDASINMPQGTAPTSPTNGDIWTTSAGLFVRANGSTQGPLGTGSGSVTSVGLTLPSFITVTGSPVTGVGTLAGSLATQTANRVFAGPTSGSAAAPTFRALVGGDFGTQSANQIFGGPVSGGAANPTFRTLTGADVTYTATGTGGSAQSLQTTLGRAVYADQFGADPTCTTDSTAAIAAAFAATTYGPVRLHGCYRASSTVIVPGGRALVGDNYSAGNPIESVDTRIVCDLAVTPCVQVGGSAANFSTSLRNLAVTRAAGTPGTSTVGVVVYGYNVTLVDINSRSHGICYQFSADATAGIGLGAYATRIFSGDCRTTHIDVDSWPELRVSQSRFGMNGTNAYAPTSYIRIRGGVSGTAGGPNTLVFDNSQFNQGNNSPSYFMDFVTLGSGGVPAIDATSFTVANSHIEGVATAVIHSDSSWNVIDRLAFTGNTFNTAGIPFLGLNAATGISEWALTGNLIFSSTFNYAGTPQISGLTWTGGRMLGSTSLVAPSGSTATMSGVSRGGNAVYTGTWGALNVIGDTFTSGSLDYSGAAGNVNVVAAQSSPAIGTGGVPVVSTCGTSPTISADSTNAGGIFTTGTGTVNSCTITYTAQWPKQAYVVVTPAASAPPGTWYLTTADKDKFVLTFGSSTPGQSFLYHVVGH